MPVLTPFRGVRYAPSIDVSDVVCPPYDVISPEEQRRLQERHPHNAVNLELPPSQGAGRYAEARRCFDEWLASGVLERDDEPSLYAYRQDFVDATGSSGTVTGIIGALELEPFGGAGGVLPHERTMPGPLADRLALMRACPVNVSPIYAIYRGDGGMGALLEAVAQRPPDATATVGDLGHRLWVESGREFVDAAANALAPGPLVIADGHHRYETALAFHAERGGRSGEADDSIMCFCVDADSADLRVLPYHRMIVTNEPASVVVDRLKEKFSARPVPADGAEQMLQASSVDHAFVFVVADDALLVELDAASVATDTAGTSASRDLDVVVLHEVVLPEVAPEIVDVTFSTDAALVAKTAREGRCSAGVLMRSLKAAQIVEVARAGERMPQKASYFWPKALTGLVFRPL